MLMSLLDNFLSRVLNSWMKDDAIGDLWEFYYCRKSENKSVFISYIRIFWKAFLLICASEWITYKDLINQDKQYEDKQNYVLLIIPGLSISLSFMIMNLIVFSNSCPSGILDTYCLGYIFQKFDFMTIDLLIDLLFVFVAVASSTILSLTCGNNILASVVKKTRIATNLNS